MKKFLTKTGVAIAAVLALVVLASVFAAPAGAATGTIVYSESGVSPAYPRVVRTADRNLLAVFGRNQISPRVELPYEFYRSTDSGTSWSLLATLTDYHGLDVTRLTAPTLFVLPQTEGAYAAGTVFVAFDYLSSSTTVGGVQIFRSTDNGATWTWHSQTAFNKYQAVWEPEFTVDSTGRLVLFYSDETQAGYNQALSREISTDGGITWGSYQIVVGNTAESAWRPGMTRIQKLNNGTYLLAYESVGDPAGGGVLRIKSSTDGDTFGAASDHGSIPNGASTSTPGLGYNPLDGSNGRLILRGSHGPTVTSTDNGATWSVIPNIVEVGTGTDEAVGFSPSYVPTSATSMLEINVAGDVPGEPARTQTRVAVRQFPVRDDFADGNDNGWARFGGSWSVSGGIYDVTNTSSGKSLNGDPTKGNYTVEADVKPVDTFNAGLVFRVTSPGTGADAMNGYFAGLGPGQVFLGKMNGSYTAVSNTAMTLSTGTVYHMKVVASGSTIKIYVSDMTTPKITVTDASYTVGQVGVRSHFAHTQFDNFVSAPIISDDFADGNDNGWTQYGGTWSASGGVYDIAGGATGKSLIGDAALGDYTIEADVRGVDAPNTGLVFRATNAGSGADAMNGYFAGLGGGSVFLGRENGSYTPLASIAMTTTIGTWYHMKIVTSGSSIKVYVTDMTTPKISITDSTYLVGQAGVRSHFAHAQFDNFLLD